MKIVLTSILVVGLALSVCSSASADFLNENSPESIYSGVANASGPSGVHWRTDAVLQNLDPVNAAVVSFNGISRWNGYYTDRIDLRLAPREYKKVENILESLFGRTGVTALRVSVAGTGVDVRLVTHDGVGCSHTPGTTLSQAVSVPLSSLDSDDIMVPLTMFPTERVNIGLGNYSDAVARFGVSIFDDFGHEVWSQYVYVGVDALVQVRATDLPVQIAAGSVKVSSYIPACCVEQTVIYVAVVDNESNTGRIVSGYSHAIIGRGEK